MSQPHVVQPPQPEKKKSMTVWIVVFFILIIVIVVVVLAITLSQSSSSGGDCLSTGCSGTDKCVQDPTSLNYVCASPVCSNLVPQGTCETDGQICVKVNGNYTCVQEDCNNSPTPLCNSSQTCEVYDGSYQCVDCSVEPNICPSPQVCVVNSAEQHVCETPCGQQMGFCATNLNCIPAENGSGYICAGPCGNMYGVCDSGQECVSSDGAYKCVEISEIY